MEKFEVGEEVYIKAKIDRIPGGEAVMYRLETPEGTVVWAKEHEIEKRKD